MIWVCRNVADFSLPGIVGVKPFFLYRVLSINTQPGLDEAQHYTPFWNPVLFHHLDFRVYIIIASFFHHNY
jgi:hypothetical protein